MKYLFIIAGLFMLMSFVSANNTTSNIIINTTIASNISVENLTKTAQKLATNIVSYNWIVKNREGNNVVYFENSMESQAYPLYIVSNSKRRLNVECVSRGDNNDLCPFLTYSQNIIIDKSENIIQTYNLNLLLHDKDRYSSELIFTDDNNVSMKVIVYAVPKSEFDFKGTRNVFGIRVYNNELALLISLAVVVLIGFFITITVGKIILLSALWIILSFILYTIISSM